jgi:transcriptional regulator with XRE-family HTH domain
MVSDPKPKTALSWVRNPSSRSIYLSRNPVAHRRTGESHFGVTRGGAMGESESFVENKRFGRYLRRAREDRKLSLDAVEEMTSGYPDRVTKSHLSRIENGSAVPSFGKMFALSQIYGIPISAMAEQFEIDLLREIQAVDAESCSPEEILAELDRLKLAGNYHEGLALVTAALDAIHNDRSRANEEQVENLRLFQVDFLAHLERYELAKVYCEQMLCGELTSSGQRLRALLCFVICCYRLKRYTIAEMALEQAERELDNEEHPVKLRATVRATRAVVQSALGLLEQAIKTYKEAISLFLEVPEPFETCRAQVNVAQTMISAGRSENALPYLRTALKRAEQSGYDRLRALALSHLAVVHSHRGDLDVAETYALRSNAIARSREFLTLVFRNCFYLRAVARERGDDDAFRANERTLKAYLSRVDPDLPELIEYRAELEGGAR